METYLYDEENKGGFCAKHHLVLVSDLKTKPQTNQPTKNKKQTLTLAAYMLC